MAGHLITNYSELDSKEREKRSKNCEQRDKEFATLQRAPLTPAQREKVAILREENNKLLKNLQTNKHSDNEIEKNGAHKFFDLSNQKSVSQKNDNNPNRNCSCFIL